MLHSVYILKHNFKGSHKFWVSLICGLLMFSNNSQAQFQTFEWARFGKGSGKEVGSFVGTDASASVYVAGSYEITTDFNPGAAVNNLAGIDQGDIFVMKSDLNGNFLWAVRIASSGWEYVDAMVVDPAGNIYLGISFGGTLDVDPGAGVVNIVQPAFANGTVLLKLNTNGGYVWSKQFGAASQSMNIQALDLDINNNVIVAGEFFNSVDINFDAPVLTFTVLTGAFSDTFIMEVSAAGAFTWAKQLRTTSTLPTITDSNYPEAVVVDDLDNIIVTGWLRGDMDVDPGAATVAVNANTNGAIYVVKLSSTGTFVWGGGVIGTPAGLWPQDIKTDAYENVYVAMYSFGGNVDFDIGAGTSLMNTVNGVPCILKLSSAGAFVWSKTFPQNAWYPEINLEVSQGATTYVLMATSFRYTKDIDPNAGVVSVTATPPYYGTLSEDEGLILKLTANGDYYDHCVLAGPDKEIIYDIAIGLGSVLYLTGEFMQTVDFDGSAATSYKTSKGAEDIFTLRLNLNLDHIWSHSIGSAGVVANLSSAKYISTQLFAGGYSLGSSARGILWGFQNKNAMISLTNSTGGGGISSYEFGGPGDDEVTSVCRDAQGNKYITGTFEQTANFAKSHIDADINRTSAGGKDIFIMKMNNSNQVVWVKRIGGTYDEEVSAITVKDNMIYLTGNYKGTVDFNPNSGTFNMVSAGNTSDIFVLKLDTTGVISWAKTIGSATAYDIGNGITVDNANNVLVTGYYSGTADFDPNAGVFNMTSYAIADIFVLKLTSAGNFVWAKSIGSASDDVGVDIITDNSNNVYHTGYFKFTADFDPGPGIYNLTTSGGATNNDGYIQKLDPNGNHLWTGHLKGTGNDKPSRITKDIAENIYVSGVFGGTIDMNPFISQTQNITSNGLNDGFILSLRVADSTCWFYNIGGAGNDEIVSVAVDSLFNVYASGNFSTTVDFDPFPPTFYITANGSPMDMFTLKLGQVSPLPIELLSFTAKPVVNKVVRCDWVTASEIDNDYFTIERSKNGIDFETAGITDGAGNSNYQLSYAFTDTDPYRGLSYYRLKQTDFDGRSSYSEIVAVMLTAKNSLIGIPNPASNEFTVYFDSEMAYDFTLTDMNGRVVFEKQEITSGYSIDTSPFASGMYQVKLSNEKVEPMYMKLVIKR